MTFPSPNQHSMSKLWRNKSKLCDVQLHLPVQTLHQPPSHWCHTGCRCTGQPQWTSDFECHAPSAHVRWQSGSRGHPLRSHDADALCLKNAIVSTFIYHAKLQSNQHHQQTNTKCFYRPDALPVAQPTVSKHWRKNDYLAIKVTRCHCRIVWKQISCAKDQIKAYSRFEQMQRCNQTQIRIILVTENVNFTKPITMKKCSA